MSAFVKVNQIAQTVESLSADPGEEFPFLHTITVVDRVVSVDKAELVQNNIKTETVTLNLDSEWEGLSTVINIGNEQPVSVIWSGEPVVIPAELMTTVGSLDVSVVGYGNDGGIRAVTKQAKNIFNVVASGYVEGDEPVPDPTTILGQLTEAADRANQAAQNADDSTIDKVNVTMLPTGSDASGSVADKTLSLSIPQGPEGPQGPKGDPGDLTTVAHDDTLDGDGTNSNPLKVVKTSGITLYKGWQDPAETGTNLNNGDIWLKTPHYLTDIDPDNPTEGASTAEYYTYAQGEEDNSPSVLVRTSQVITDLLEYSDGAWWSLIWRVESSLTPGKETPQSTAVASTLSEAELLTRIEALEAEVKSLKGAE